MHEVSKKYYVATASEEKVENFRNSLRLVIAENKYRVHESG